MGVRFPPVLLLAGRQAALHSRVEKSLLSLEGEQTERSEIYARFRPDKALKAGVGLAGVRSAEMNYEAARHGSGGGIFVLRVKSKEKREARSDRAGHVPYGVDSVDSAREKLSGGEVLKLEKRLDRLERARRNELFAGGFRSGFQSCGIA